VTIRRVNQCEAEIAFEGDDLGDKCTFRCLLSRGHSGRHAESGEMNGQHYVVTWEDKPVASKTEEAEEV